MKEQVVEKLKEVEEKLQNDSPLENQDIIFLFGLSLIKDQKNGD